MKTAYLGVLILLAGLVACNEDPDICIERKPIPVIYSVFNKYDTVNFIYVTKTWSGDNGGTLATAVNPDSIWFKDVDVAVDLARRVPGSAPPRRERLRMVPPLEWIHDKDSGMFAWPDCPVYVVHRDLIGFDSVIARIGIPGYDTIVLNFSLITTPLIRFPHKDGMTIGIYPDKGLIVNFVGGQVNQAKFYFEVITSKAGELTTQNVLIEKYMSSGAATFSYDYLRAGLLQQIPYRSDIEWRRLGKVNLEIWAGYGNFPMLPDRREITVFNNDYTLPGSPKIPKLFFAGGSIGTNAVHNLELDYLTHEAIAKDTMLAKLRFARW
jgi:hypothetical protein